MNNCYRAAAALLLALPFVCKAGVVEIPELGVRFTAMPDGVTHGGAVERPTGYEWQGSLTLAILRVYRKDAPESPGANVLDKDYRAQLAATRHLAELGGAASTLGSHAAWTVTSVRRTGPVVISDWRTYAVVDDHLYTLTVSSIGSAAQAAGFDALVKAASGISFEAVRRPPPPPLKEGDMPRFVSSGNHDFYPPKAIRLNEQGVVGVVFSIDGQGHTRNLGQVYSDSPDLTPTAAEMLQDGVFRVPSNWEETASDKQRFFMEVQFFIVGQNGKCPTLAPREPSFKTVTICRRSLGADHQVVVPAAAH